MGAFRQQSEQAFGADHGAEVGFQVTVDGCQEQVAAGRQYPGAGMQQFLGVRYVLQQFHTGEYVKTAGIAGSEAFQACGNVFDLQAVFLRMPGSYPDDCLAGVQPPHRCAEARQGLRQNAAAAADVEHTPAVKRYVAADIGQAHRVDIVQGFHGTCGIPPVTGEAFEFFNLVRVDIFVVVVHKDRIA